MKEVQTCSKRNRWNLNPALDSAHKNSSMVWNETGTNLLNYVSYKKSKSPPANYILVRTNLSKLQYMDKHKRTLAPKFCIETVKLMTRLCESIS